MNRTKAFAVLWVALMSGSTLFAQNSDALKFYGDLRLRVERDYNVTGKDTRDRARYRFRFGLTHKRGDHIELGARLATGNPTDQQSPHQNFGDDFSAKSFNLDKIYFKYTCNSGWLWIGKNSFPFWKQNELFWDDDVTPEGIAGAYRVRDFAGPGSNLTLTAGQFIIDDFNDLFGSSMTAGQIALHKKTNGVQLSAGAGLYYFNNKAGDSNSYNALNDLDHNIFVASVQIKFNAGDVPVTLGGDVMKNLKDLTVAGLEDETNGFVAQVRINPGKWTAAAYYTHIETFAVIANFAQDDWWRFGSGHTNSSNLQGFELRLAYKLADKINLVARHYVTESIVGNQEANRFRLDLNVKY